MNEVVKWLPDWRDEKSYDFPKKNDWSRWAWEFLRRNPEYQEAWREYYIDGPLKWVVKLFEERKSLSSKEMVAVVSENEDRWDNFICEPPALPEETEDQWIARVKKGTKFVLGGYLAGRFGLSSSGLCNPSIDVPPISWVTFKSLSSPSFLGWGPTCLHPEAGMNPEKPEHFVVRFNLEWPLEMQWKRLERAMKARRKRLTEEGLISPENPRNHVENFPNYLRVLDGEASGASARDMAVVIFPDKPNDYPDQAGDKTVRNNLTAAKRLRDEGYQFFNFKSW